MDKKIIKFGDTEIQKHKFPQQKKPFFINNIDFNKIIVSDKVSLCKNGSK